MSATTTVTDTTTINPPDNIHLSNLYDKRDKRDNKKHSYPRPLDTNKGISPAKRGDGFNNATSTTQKDAFDGAGDIESQPPSPKKSSIAAAAELPDGPPGTTVVTAQDTASFDRAMKWKIFATHFSIFCAGANDGCLGPLIPYLKVYYNIGLEFVALVYILGFLGWLVAAMGIVHLTARLRIGGVLFVGAIFQLVGRALMCWAPPYPLYVSCFFIIGVGIAFQDAHANTFNANLPKHHLFLGVLHAIYGVGALVAPLMATAIASSGVGTSRWNYFYFLSVGLETLNLCCLAYAFRDDVAEVLKKLRQRASSSSSGSDVEDETRAEERRAKTKRANKELRAILSRREVWVLCGFFFLYVGAEVTAGGWVVEFMIEVRHGQPQKMGYIASAFWGGLTLGRIVLAEPTERFGIRVMIFVYIAVSLGVQLVFWFVPSILVGAIMIGLLGFFIGPFFPAGISLASKLLPQELHAGSISIMATVGCLGSAAFPFLTGAVAASKGVQVLQPILVGLLAAMGLLWTCVPRVKDRQEQQQGQQGSELQEL